MTTRRLAAILAADVVGFSSMMEKDEEGTPARVEGPSAGGHRAEAGRTKGGSSRRPATASWLSSPARSRPSVVRLSVQDQR